MQIIEVTNRAEARRAKGAQYTGIEKTLMLAGQNVSGVVTSVAEDTSGLTVKWLVRIQPARQQKAFIKPNVWTRTR